MGLAVLGGSADTPEEACYEVMAKPSQACVCAERHERPGARFCTICGAALEPGVPGVESALSLREVPRQAESAALQVLATGDIPPRFDGAVISGRPVFVATVGEPAIVAGIEDAEVPGRICSCAPALPESRVEGAWLGIAGSRSAEPFAIFAWERRLWVYNAFSARAEVLWTSQEDAQCIRRPALAVQSDESGRTVRYWAAAPVRKGNRLTLEAWCFTPGEDCWEHAISAADRLLAPYGQDTMPCQASLLTAADGKGFEWWTAQSEEGKVKLRRCLYSLGDNGGDLVRESTDEMPELPGYEGRLAFELDFAGAQEQQGFLPLHIGSCYYLVDIGTPLGLRGYNSVVRVNEPLPAWWRRWSGPDGDYIVWPGNDRRLMIVELATNRPFQADGCHVSLGAGCNSGQLLSVDAEARVLSVQGRVYHGRSKALEEPRDHREFISPVVSDSQSAWILAADRFRPHRNLTMYNISPSRGTRKTQ